MAESTTRIGARRPWLVALGFLLAAVAILLGYRHYPADAPFSRDRVPRLGHAPLTVVPGVHMLGGLSPSAAYVIETSAGLVLVDSGLDADAGLLKSQMAKLGLDWKGVQAILLTHVHGDHTGGAESLRSATGAKVYAGAGDAPVLRAGQPREAFFSTFHMPGQTIHPTTVDVALRGDETLAFGDARVRAIGTPGHTPGSICYLLERKGLRALFAGDVILMLRGDEKPRTELGKPLGTYSAYLAPRYRGNARDYLASLLQPPRLAGPGPRAAGPSGRGRHPAEPLPVAGALGVAARWRHSRHGDAHFPVRSRRREFPGREPEAALARPLLPRRLPGRGRLRALRLVEVLRRGATRAARGSPSS